MPLGQATWLTKIFKDSRLDFGFRGWPGWLLNDRKEIPDGARVGSINSHYVHIIGDGKLNPNSRGL